MILSYMKALVQFSSLHLFATLPVFGHELRLVDVGQLLLILTFRLRFEHVFFLFSLFLGLFSPFRFVFRKLFFYTILCDSFSFFWTFFFSFFFVQTHPAVHLPPFFSKACRALRTGFSHSASSSNFHNRPRVRDIPEEWRFCFFPCLFRPHPHRYFFYKNKEFRFICVLLCSFFLVPRADSIMS